MSGKNGGANGRAPGKRGNGKATVREAIVSASPAGAGKVDVPPGFEMRENGWWHDPGAGKTPFRMCGPIEFVAETRPGGSDDWGLLLRWKDRDGIAHDWIMLRRLLAGEAVQVREHLSACGLYVAAFEGARRALVQFLISIHVPSRIRTANQTGWYRPKTGGAAFVLPGRVLGAVVGEVVRLSLDPPPTVYVDCGRFDARQSEVAARCVGNLRLVFGPSCAFTAPLLALAETEGGAFNLRGETSTGKTTIIDVAGNARGAPSKTGPDAFVRQWRTTSNALETTLATHNHTFCRLMNLARWKRRKYPRRSTCSATAQERTGADRVAAIAG
jgi:putative DNA primase/helicase